MSNVYLPIDANALAFAYFAGTETVHASGGLFRSYDAAWISTE